MVSVAVLTLVSCAKVPTVREGGAAKPAATGPRGLSKETSLRDYVRHKDGAFRWKLLSKARAEGATMYVLDMTSQRWRSAKEVDRTLWQHWVTIVVPDSARARPPKGRKRTALLVIGGGSNGRGTPKAPDGKTLGLAKTTGSIVVGLSMVPNQPLAFSDDGRKRWEDDLIAHTWNKYMDTGVQTWLARWPMVKSAVKAMDACQQLLASDDGGKLRVDRFVVAGGSKRGWTTWLTGAVDKRVVAIVPIVIDVVNTIPSMEHHLAAYGFWAPAVGDYVRNGIMKRRKDPQYLKLIKLVDPYFYRDRLKMPKLILNSAGDQFFLPDSSRFYFDDLEGEKYLRYVPNTDHGLGDSDAIETVAAYFLAVTTGTPRPRFDWKFEDDGGIRVTAADRPSAVKLWQATNPQARDFRKESIGSAYTSTPIEADTDGAFVGRVAAPEKGWTAYFVELTWVGKGPVPLKLTTAVRVVPDVLPHRDKLEELRENPSEGE